MRVAGGSRRCPRCRPRGRAVGAQRGAARRRLWSPALRSLHSTLPAGPRDLHWPCLTPQKSSVSTRCGSAAQPLSKPGSARAAREPPRSSPPDGRPAAAPPLPLPPPPPLGGTRRRGKGSVHLGQRTCQVREHGSNNVLLTMCLHPLGSLGTSLQDVERPRTRCLNFFFKAGGFYVDKTCIDCDTCRWMAPATFARVGEQSAVTAQPATAEQRHAALQVGCGTCRHVGEQQVVTKRSKESTTFPHPLPQALLACPTFSIHCTDRRPGELKAAQESFPLPIPGCPSVFHTGFAAESSFGATAYFIRRPQVWWAALLHLHLMQVAASRLHACGRRTLSQQLVALPSCSLPRPGPPPRPRAMSWLMCRAGRRC